jgi:membrane protease YdiL (CAAX protease family)
VIAVFVVSLAVVGNVALSLLGENARLGYWSVLQQAIAYGVMLLAMKVIFFCRQQPLFRSLGWHKTVFGVSSLAAIGFCLFLLSVILQLVLRTPEVSTPFEKLLRSDMASRLAITIFGITLGPMIEELVFRGFLQPVLVNVAGVFPGILITAALFGGVHLAQNAGMWQSGVIITLAGFGFGMVRHITGSTQASTIAHVAYNTLPFLATTLDNSTK